MSNIFKYNVSASNFKSFSFASLALGKETPSIQKWSSGRIRLHSRE